MDAGGGASDATFIDESGDTGHAADSSSHFHLAAVWVPTHDAAEALRSDIERLRQTLRLPQGWEFKFSKGCTHRERRRVFFQTMLGHEFRFAVASIDKRHNPWRTVSTEGIHVACASSLAKTLHATYLAEKTRRAAGGSLRTLGELVVVDNNQDKEFLSALKQAFRGLASAQKPKASLVRDVRFRASQSNELLQLADMVCGAAAACLAGERIWYKLIAPRCLKLELL